MNIPASKQVRHARYIDPSVPYHVVTKTLRGQFILAPKKGIRELCAGVLAKAQLNWPCIKLYGYAFMSNHIHLMLQGPPSDFSAFMGFLKASSTPIRAEVSAARNALASTLCNERTAYP